MANGGQARGRPGGMRRGGADFQQMLNRMPTVTLADLHKGDAVLIVATQGSAAGRDGDHVAQRSGANSAGRSRRSQAMMLDALESGRSAGRSHAVERTCRKEFAFS